MPKHATPSKISSAKKETSPSVKQAIVLLLKMLENRQPKAILQIGAGTVSVTAALCETIAKDEDARLTLIEPQHNDNTKKVFNALAQMQLADSFELLTANADQVLPDLYFQELIYDLAVINPCDSYDETFVACYFLDKLLSPHALLIVNQADSEIMRKLCRHWISSGLYRVKENIAITKNESALIRLARNRYQHVPNFIRTKIEMLINPNLLLDDESLGLTGSLIVLERAQEKTATFVDVDDMIEALASE